MSTTALHQMHHLRRPAAVLAALVLGAAALLAGPSAAAASPPPPTGNVRVDPAFTGGVEPMVASTARQTDGKIVTYGLNSETLKPSLLRVSPSGAADPTFVQPSISGGTGAGWVIAQPDDKLIITGDFVAINGVPRAGAARLNADGTLDTSFAPVMKDLPPFLGDAKATLQPDGKIVLAARNPQAGFGPTGGNSSTFANKVLVRLSPTGAYDPTFGATLTETWVGYRLAAIVLQPDGKFLLGGTFMQVNGIGRNGIARITSTGSVDPAFDPGGGFGGEPCLMCPPVKAGVGVRSLALQPDGKVVVGGTFTIFDWFPANQLIRLNTNGRRDTTFDSGTGVSVFGQADPVPSPAGATSDGLDPQTIAYIKSIDAIVMQPDGKAVIGGHFETYRGTMSPGLARVNTNGSIDLTFDVGAGFYGKLPMDEPRGGTVDVLMLLPTGNILAGGAFEAFDEHPVSNLTSLTVGPQGPPAEFTALANPVRVFDSRGGGAGPQGQYVVDATGGGAVDLPVGTTAVAVNLTITGQTASGYATIGRDDGRAYPAPCPASAINWSSPQQTISNAVVTGLNSEKQLKVCVAGRGTAHAIVDVTGYYAPSGGSGPAAASGGAAVAATGGAVFVPLNPVRAYDSRAVDGPLAGGAHRTLHINAATPAPMPDGATAVAYNLTATGTTASGYLAVAPGGAAEPATSAINWTGANQTIANAGQVGVAANKSIEVFAGGTGTTHLTVDLVGYFAPQADLPPGVTGLALMPIPASRAYDSRTKDGPLSGNPTTGAPGSGRTTSITLDGALPAQTRAVAVNLTATGTTSSGYLTSSPSATPVPSTSVLNWPRTSTTIANASISGTSPTGDLTTWAGGRGTAHYLMDIYGYYVPME